MERLKLLKRSLWPRLDVRLRRVGWYATATVNDAAYLGTVAHSLPDLERELAEMGFSFGFVAALKDRDCPGDCELEAGSWVRRESRRAHYQLHVHLFSNRTDGRTDVYCHHEYNWKRHPIRHYRGAAVDPERGRQLLAEEFTERGIDFHRLPRDRRCHV